MPTVSRIANGHLAVEVSSLGSEMQSIRTKDGKSWLWNGDAAFWTGRSPILFPIVGKAPDDTLTIDGKSYRWRSTALPAGATSRLRPLPRPHAAMNWQQATRPAPSTPLISCSPSNIRSTARR